LEFCCNWKSREGKFRSLLEVQLKNEVIPVLADAILDISKNEVTRWCSGLVLRDLIITRRHSDHGFETRQGRNSSLVLFRIKCTGMKLTVFF
jgi:hypothetical protein